MADDVNLPLARIRARGGGSPGGHNGLASVQESLGTSDYARLRVGVGRGDERWDLSNYVLSRFGSEETDPVTEMVGRAAEAAEMFVTEGLDRMMNRYKPGGTTGTETGRRVGPVTIAEWRSSRTRPRGPFDSLPRLWPSVQKEHHE